MQTTLHPHQSRRSASWRRRQIVLFLLFLAISLAAIAFLLKVSARRIPVHTPGTVQVLEAQPEIVSLALPELQQVTAISTSNPSTQSLQSQTLATLKRIDDHPLYVMTYYGDYDLGIEQPQALEHSSAQAWACSLFATYANPDNALFGRNFDWENNPALLLFTDPSDGYASVSMVDISYLGYDHAHVNSLQVMEGRTSLLRAPRLPFDGMNEHGLTVGMAAVDGSKTPRDPKKPTVGSLRIIRLMLDRAKTTEEAIEVFQSFTIDFDGGPQIHYLIADPTGSSAVIELKDGKIHVIRNERQWQSATNFYLAGSSKSSQQADTRYRTLMDELAKTRGLLEMQTAMALLKSVAQPHTRWSVVYGMSTGEVQLTMGKRFGKVYRFTLPMGE